MPLADSDFLSPPVTANAIESKSIEYKKVQSFNTFGSTGTDEMTYSTGDDNSSPARMTGSESCVWSESSLEGSEVSHKPSLYSVHLPGVGKVLAISGNLSCDVDTLYDQNKMPCDVDAFVGCVDTDDEDIDVEMYKSPVKSIAKSDSSTRGTIDENFDLEACNESIGSLDPQCDPFAHRSGKKLTWRNVNMCLVSPVNCIFC